MISNLEKAKNNLQLKKLECAKDEFEVKILEALDRIEHLKNQIEIQDKAIVKIKTEIGEY